jgi:glycosyltransferase involved in cell wall biosynthesis
MKINFLLPCYAWSPSGGFKVAYEYANQLVARGHEVTVIHPRLLKFPPLEKMTLRKYARKVRLWLKESVSQPSVNWHRMDARVRLCYVPNSGRRYIPNGDILFATAWHTVRSVLECPPEKGEKCYLIQGYETFQGPKDLVDATWRAPLHKIVASQWLAGLGEKLGASKLSRIPNGIEHESFRITKPIATRKQQVTMMVSDVPLKRSLDAVKALEITKLQFPGLCARAYGTGRRPTFLPDWVEYYRNPSRNQLVTDILNDSSIVLASSEAEGFGLPPAEGAACGCAMVSTDSGGVRDFVIHGETGLLSPPRDPEALARNLCLLLGDDGLRIRLAEAGRNLVASFTWERSADLMESFLNDVLAGSLRSQVQSRTLGSLTQSHQLEIPRLEG